MRIGLGLALTNSYASAGDPYPGYHWYVDSVNGDDGNSGTSSLQPFASIGKLATVWQAGQSVGLAKGSTWHEELMFPGDNSAAYAYGESGAKPIFDASDVIPNANFVKTAGRTNVYEVAVTLESGRLTEDKMCMVWENDAHLPFATSLANCDATPGTRYIAAHSGEQTLYIHPAGSSNPISNGKTYTVSVRIGGAYGLSTAGVFYNGCTLVGVRTQKNLGKGGSLKMGRSSIITDCDAYYGSHHNVYVGDGSILTNVNAVEAYSNASFSMFVYNETSPTGLGITFTNCNASLSTFDSNGVGFYGHNNTNGTFGTVTYNGCSVVKCFTGYNGLDAALVITNCSVTGCNLGVEINVNTTITGGTWAVLNIFCQAATAGVSYSVTGATATETAGGQAPIYHTVNDVTVSVTNCTFNSVWYPVYITGTGQTVTLDGNTYITSQNYMYYRLPGSGLTLTSDHNHFVTGNAPDFNIGGVSYGDVAAYQAGTGQDANSTVG